MVCQRQQLFVTKPDYDPLYLNTLTLTDSYFCKNTSGVARLAEQSTATYCAVVAESGEMILGLGDMDIHQEITEKYVSYLCILSQG